MTPAELRHLARDLLDAAHDMAADGRPAEDICDLLEGAEIAARRADMAERDAQRRAS